MAAGNSVNDEIREQRQKLKGKPFKEKWAYFWEYYRFPTLIILAVLIMGGDILYTILSQKDSAIEVALVNTYLPQDADEELLSDDFLQYAGIDSKKMQAAFYTNMTIDYEQISEMGMTNAQKLMAMVAANTLDIIISDDSYLEQGIDGQMFLDLRTVFPADLLEQYADKLRYADIPEDGVEEEVPVAIDVREAPFLFEGHRSAWFSVIVNTKRPETCVTFFRYMMGLENPDAAAAAGEQ